MLDLTSYYLWIKSFHIIGVICWMAALLYLPRLYVYHAQTEAGSSLSNQFLVMESRLIKIIMNPAMLITYFFGILLYLTPGIVTKGEYWFHLKLLFVLILSGMHGMMIRWHKGFQKEERKLSHTYFRVANEIPAVIMVVIVVMVVVKPF